MPKLICSICSYTLQEGENNKEIKKYKICGKCHEKWKILIDYFTGKDKKSE
jgi:hypothetical protein